MVNSLHGIIVPLITPFDERGQIDFGALRQVVDFVIGQGVHAVMVGGTTGEGMLMSVAERKALLEAVLEQNAGRVPVIAHTGCIDTASTVELTKHARAAGANYASAIVPYFFTFNDDSLFAHFKAVADSVPEFPLMLYAFPGNAKNDISPALLGRLRAAAPNIVGIKSSNDDLIRFQDYVEAGGRAGDGVNFTPCFGVDELMLGGLVFGSRAQISGNANSFAAPFIQLYEAFQSGDLARAQEFQQRVNRIVQIHHAGRTTAFFKATLKMQGIPGGCTRPPMRELTKEEVEEVQREVKLAGLV